MTDTLTAEDDSIRTLSGVEAKELADSMLGRSVGYPAPVEPLRSGQDGWHDLAAEIFGVAAAEFQRADPGDDPTARRGWAYAMRGATVLLLLCESAAAERKAVDDRLRSLILELDRRMKPPGQVPSVPRMRRTVERGEHGEITAIVDEPIEEESATGVGDHS